MTETEEILQENSQETPEQEKERLSRAPGGRPPGARNKPKEPEPPFFDRLPSVDWTNHIVFLSRIEPITDRKRTGDFAYIQKFAEPFDMDTVLKDSTWGGSGVYKANLYMDPGGKKNKIPVAEHYFEVMNQAYPPRFPLSQWIDDPKNKRWAWARTIMEKEEGIGNPPQQNHGNNPADIVRAAKEMAQIFQPNTKASDPADVIKTAVEAYTQGRKQGEENAKDGGIGLLLPLITQLMQRPEPKPDNSVLEMMKLQLDMEREQRRADREQAQRDRDAAEKRADAAEKRHSDLMGVMLARKDDSGTDIIEKAGKLISMVNDIREGTAGEADSSWMGLAKEGLREALPHLAPQLAGMAGGLLNSLPLGPRPNVPQQSVPRETIAPVPEPVPAQPQQDPHLPVYQFILNNFEAMNNMMPQVDGGYVFGDWIAAGPGPMMLERFKAAGTERIIAIFRTVPQAWEHLGPVEARFRAFLNELMNWTPDEAEEDEETEPDPNVPVGKVEVIVPPPAKPAAKAKVKGKG